MASFASRSLRSASRMILQTTGSQGGRISSQGTINAVRRHCKLQSIQALHQAAGVSLAKQAQKQFVVSISRTVASCTLITTGNRLGNHQLLLRKRAWVSSRNKAKSGNLFSLTNVGKDCMIA
ncbi:uncharacterized protein [Porites lutea]|uniref:uncharacterized protein isoform X1 n=1 Tax=Porites lutea TaxID=51062 RepID=UPI003CC624E7